MTDTVTEKATKKKTCPKCRHAAHVNACLNMASDNECGCMGDLPVQVLPQVIQDPLYAEVIGSLERDLHESRDRCHKAESKVRELSQIHDQVELLRDQIERMRNELDATKNLVTNGNQYVEAMYKVISKVFRQ